MTHSSQTDKKSESEKPTRPEPPPPTTAQHQLKIGDKLLDYTTTTGMIPLKNADSEIEAYIFYMAYTLNGVEDKTKRPLIFVFNGGPGSASVWLHLGAVGPKRVKMQDEGWLPAPPYQLVANEYTWLDIADLVFVDPVGTGYSYAVKSDNNKKYWNIQGDLESVGEFIRLYLVESERWTSPLFLAGESYGTTRAAGLAGHLIDKGIAFNGLILISTTLNFQTLHFVRGNDLPYALFLPTYAATAWYHGKLPSDLQNKPLGELITEVEAWAETDYTTALAKGDRLSPSERSRIIRRLSRYTGLSNQYLDLSDLRVVIHRFCAELLRDQRRTVGRLDSRFQGFNPIATREFPEFDPSLTDITPPYTAMINQYIRAELGYKIDRKYEVLSFDVNQAWEWEKGRFSDTSEHLRLALAKNKFMKVLVAQGYYDLATPHFAAQYTLTHSDIDAALRDNIQMTYYEAGHMMYLDVNALAKLRDDVYKFIDKALAS